MAVIFCFFLFTSLTSLHNTAEAQGRAPHGLAYEKPLAFSPSAYDFFHPNPASGPVTHENPCVGSRCAPIPLSSFSSSSAVVMASPDHESKFSTASSRRRSRIGAGGIAGILFGFVLAVLTAMGVLYVVKRRRTNVTRSNFIRPGSC
ncbi:hypothetical protein OROGR_005027 [Orobanche gracilis]